MISHKAGRTRSKRTKAELEAMLRREMEHLSPEEREAVQIIISEVTQPPSDGASLLEVFGKAEFERIPVDMDTFVRDPYYLGATCDNIYPTLLGDLKELFSGGYHEAVFTGSIGWGKTHIATIGVCRILYELSCMKDPHKSFGLARGSNMSLVCTSVSETLAVKVVFESIATKLTSSPYFEEHFPFKDTKKDLVFPNGIWVAARSSTDTSALGLNAFGALLDESNFLPRTIKDIQSGALDRAETLYNTIQRRMKSRFERHGKLPGMIFIVSSKNTINDFTAKRIRESKDDPTVFVRDYPLWGPKPKDQYSSKKFWVLCGNETVPSKIITDEEHVTLSSTLPENVVFVDVPEDFRRDFERDIEGSIRDLAGMATVSINPFIQRREKILEAVDPARVHPFSTLVYDPSKGGQFLWPLMVQEVSERGYSDISTRQLRPILNPKALRHIHVDPSLRNDSTGFCMSHIGGYKNVARRGEDGKEYVERAPMYVIDVMLRIVPPTGGEIVLSELRHLIYDLGAHGYMIAGVTLDSWQSADTIQQLNQRGFKSEILSVDTSPDPYDNLKTALYEGRVSYYSYPPVEEELQQLERKSNGRKTKIDHPPKGCFTGSTRVALLDGTLPTFEELAVRFKPNEQFAVYSIGPEGVCAGWGRNSRVTKQVTELVEVTLDNYQVIECTPDHRFMLLSGDWVRAENLTPEMSLMPLYRSRLSTGGWAGYERLWCPRRKLRVLTHQLVGQQLFGSTSGQHVHHRNETKHDNAPGNLELKSRGQHLRDHTLLRHADATYVSKLRTGHLRYRENGGNEKSRENILRLFEEGKLKRGRAGCLVEGCASLSSAGGMCGKHYQHIRRERQKVERTSLQSNHRAISVRRISRIADVWDLTVEGLENFALASGVFVHNSKDVADALAASCYALSNTGISQPLPIMRGLSYSGDAWMEEQRQSALAGAPRASQNTDVLPAFLTGGGGNGGWNSGNGGDDGGGSWGNGGGGWYPG